MKNVINKIADLEKRLGKWVSNPKGWDTSSRKQFWESITEGAKHKRTKCMEKLKGHPEIDDVGAFCNSLYDEFENK